MPEIRRAQGARQKTSFNASSSKEKKSLPEPTHVGHFVMMVLIYFTKKVLFVGVHVKIGVHMAVVVVGSVISDIFPPPRTYFSNSGNWMNQFFVKWAWGWTLFSLLPLVSLATLVGSQGNWRVARRHLCRLLVLTGVWWVVTFGFRVIQRMTARCSTGGKIDKTVCIQQGGEWISFDPSGHTFLLIFSVLVIAEECRVYLSWETVTTDLVEDPRLRKVLGLLRHIIKANLVELALLSLLWETMLVATTLYFHTIAHKVVGASTAVGAWFLTYRWWFQSEFSPGMPCQDLVS